MSTSRSLFRQFPDLKKCLAIKVPLSASTASTTPTAPTTTLYSLLSGLSHEQLACKELVISKLGASQGWKQSFRLVKYEPQKAGLMGKVWLEEAQGKEIQVSDLDALGEKWTIEQTQ